MEARDLLSGIATPDYQVFYPNGGAGPFSGSGPGGYTPSQISQAYGFNQLSFTGSNGPVAANGAGETIAIVDAYRDLNITSDLQAFDAQYKLPNPNLAILNENGGTDVSNVGTDSTGGWELEESLDVEWAHAIAPGANIVFIEANSSSFSDLFTAVQTAAAIPGVVAVSMSWGGSEFNNDGNGNSETYYDKVFVAPSSNPGVVYICSSGDSGAPVSYPAISPNVLAVGGTTLKLDSAGDYQSETVWSGSGGGISAYEPLPSYQPGGYTNGTQSGTSNMRMNPDVAYDADPGTGFPVYDTTPYYGSTGPWYQVGGTSDAAPQWAALVAITDQGRGLAGESALSGSSQLLPTLYQIPGDFHDITSGTTTGSPHWTAGTGYDLTTGLGTPIANYLVPDLIYGKAPATPTGLQATAVSSSQINLTWNSSTDAQTYTLERSLDDTNWQVDTTTSSTSYSDTGLQASTTYYYRVLATNGFGSSTYSTPVSATTQGSNSSATFLKKDMTTQGNWQGAYGSQGYNVINNATDYPSYAQVSTSGNSSWTWTNSTSDPRALEDASGSGRIAACWYSSTSYTINLNITDGLTHQVALYLLDWDNWEGGRSEKVDILDASSGALLDSETASSFQSGDYLVWNISGNVVIRVTNLEGSSTNAVISGLFFDPKGSQGNGSGSAQFLKKDLTTQGNWQGVYGSQGYNVINNATNYPSYAQVSSSGNSSWTWSSSTSDSRALEDASGSGRIAACWYSSTSYTINLNITDGLTHQVSLYLLDWDNWEGGRSEEVDILDASSGKLLDSETVSSFQSGDYLVWNISGNVVIRVTNLENSSTNAVISGLFFDAKGSQGNGSGSAQFLKKDLTTQGNWQGVYGSQGYNVINNATNYPSYAQVSSSGNSSWTWTNSTSDPRALEDASGSGRIAACWYSSTSYTINLNITDGLTHQVALYLLDWDNWEGGRSEEIDILDASTGNLLSSETVSNFQNGDYMVWNISGNVVIRVTNLEGSSTNAVISGLFFDPKG